MRDKAWALGAVFLAMPLLLGQGAAPAARGVIVRNNTLNTLKCVAGGETNSILSQMLKQEFVIPPGAEFGYPGGAATLACEPPVEQVRYELEIGKRYSFLRSSDQVVRIREITVGN